MLRSPLFPELSSLQHTLDRLVTTAFDESRQGRRGGVNGHTVPVPMPIDVFGTDDRVVILAEVPGMQAEELDLSINENTITISGSIRSAVDAEEAKDATWYVSEIARGTYQRSITLPFAVDADKAEAMMDAGILRITLPKAEANRTRKIAISTGSTSPTAIDATNDGGTE